LPTGFPGAQFAVNPLLKLRLDEHTNTLKSLNDQEEELARKHADWMAKAYPRSATAVHNPTGGCGCGGNFGNTSSSSTIGTTDRVKTKSAFLNQLNKTLPDDFFKQTYFRNNKGKRQGGRVRLR
jgi:hypothetical protein